MKEEGLEETLDDRDIYNISKGLDTSGLAEELGIDFSEGNLEQKLKALIISAKLIHYNLGENQETKLKETYDSIIIKIGKSDISIKDYIESNKPSLTKEEMEAI